MAIKINKWYFAIIILGVAVGAWALFVLNRNSQPAESPQTKEQPTISTSTQASAKLSVDNPKQAEKSVESPKQAEKVEFYKYGNKEFGMSFYSKAQDCKFYTREEICKKLTEEGAPFDECPSVLFGEFSGKDCGIFYFGYDPTFYYSDLSFAYWGPFWGPGLKGSPDTLKNGLMVHYAIAEAPLSYDLKVFQAYVEYNGKYFYTWGNISGCAKNPTPTQLSACLHSSEKFKNFVEVAETLDIFDSAAISSWPKYQNAKYGYSISYPGEFTIFSSVSSKLEIIPPTSTSDEVKFTNDKKMLLCCEPTVSSIKVIPGLIDVRNWKKYVYVEEGSLKSEKFISFAGKYAYELRGPGGYGSDGVRMILIGGEKYSYIIIQGGTGYPWDEITNSFKFD